MNEKRRLIRNTGIIAIGNISTKLVSFFLLPLYTALLNTAEYGTIDYFFSISVFFVPVISVLMDESIFRFLIDCKGKRERKKVISTAMVIIAMGGTVFLIGCIPVLIILKYKYSIFLIAYIIISVLSSMISALLRGLGDIEKYVIYNFLISALNIILNILFIVVFRWGVIGMLSASILSVGLISVFYIFWLKMWKYLDFHDLDKKQVYEMVRYSIPLIPNKLSWSIINLSDRIIIMNFIGSSASGLYAIAYKFPNLMDTIYGFFYQSWKESSARALQGDGVDAFYNQVYTYLKRFMYSVVIGMVAFMPLAFKLLINANYQESIVYVPILLLGTYFSNISGFYGGIFTAFKDTKIMGTTTMAAALINIVLNIAMIWKFGLYAAAISTLIANFVVYIYRRIKVKRYVVLKENNIETAVACAITAIIFVLFYSRDMKLQLMGCVIVVIYALVENYKIIAIVIQRKRR